MVKFMGIFTLKPGNDPDEYHRLWKETHTRWAIEKLSPEMKSYTIGRVVGGFGNSGIYGVAQIEFESLDDANRAFARLIGSPPDRFLSGIDVKRIIIEEEPIVVRANTGKAR